MGTVRLRESKVSMYFLDPSPYREDIERKLFANNKENSIDSLVLIFVDLKLLSGCERLAFQKKIACFKIYL